MFTIVCGNLSAPNRHRNSYNSSCPNRENHSWDGDRGLHVLKSHLIMCLVALHVLAQDQSCLRSDLVFIPRILITLLWDLNQLNSVWIIHLLILLMLPCTLWLSSKRIRCPGWRPPPSPGLPLQSLPCQCGPQVDAFLQIQISRIMCYYHKSGP